MNDKTIEQEIVAAGANVAPRVTPDDLKANIVAEYYFTARQGVDGADLEAVRNAHPGDNVSIPPIEEEPGIWKTQIAPLELLTFCVLVLRNGFTVTGESACASPENFNAEIGQRIARDNAVANVWPLMGYALKESMSADKIGGAA